MAGGAYEYVMGNFGNISGSSGFTTFPESKYYDLYLSSRILEQVGHALYETSYWYEDLILFGVSPWVTRGGVYYFESYSGAFNAYYADGSGNDYYSWRSVLVVDGA